jgi:hypothetical protein
MKCFIAVSLLLVVSVAHADIRPEIGIGESSYRVYPDGTWYQLGMPHRLNLHSSAFKLGLTGPIITSDSWGIDWHADYVDIGHASSWCKCTSDANYSDALHKEINHNPGFPNARYVGHGLDQGFNLSLAPHIQFHGIEVGYNYGLFPYKPHWNEVIYDWSNGLGGSLHTLYGSTPHSWRLGVDSGFYLKKGRYTLSYEHYRPPTRYDAMHDPSLMTDSDVLMLEIRL